MALEAAEHYERLATEALDSLGASMSHEEKERKLAKAQVYATLAAAAALDSVTSLVKARID